MIMWLLSAAWNCLAVFGVVTLWHMWRAYGPIRRELRFVDDSAPLELRGVGDARYGVRLVHLVERRQQRTVVWNVCQKSWSELRNGTEKTYWADTGVTLDPIEWAHVNSLLVDHDEVKAQEVRKLAADVHFKQAVDALTS